MQHVRAPDRHRPGAGLRDGLPDRGDPGRRPERPGRRRSPQVVHREPVQVRRPEKETRPGVFYRAPTRPPWTRWPPAAPTAACSPGPRRARRARRPWSPGIPGSPAPRRRRCCPTTCRTRRRGAGGSACTPGPRASPPAPSRARRARPGRAPGLGAARWPAGRLPSWRWRFLGCHRGAADRRPGAPGPVLPDLHPAALAELAGPRLVHARRLRRRGQRSTCSPSLAGRTGARQVLAGIGAAAGRPPRRATPRTCSPRPRRRDLWQSPLLAPHLAVQAALAGAAAILPLLALAGAGQPGGTACEVVLAVGGRAARDPRRRRGDAAACDRARAPGRQRDDPGPLRAVLLAGAGRAWPVAIAAPWIGVAAVPFALAGLLAHEHAYVQAGQSVPLA